MCGIVGVLGKKNVVPTLLESLRRLEYRGYDSAGIATLDRGVIRRCRAEGKIVKLDESLRQSPIQGNIGIGHTRWATHGAPSTRNAHPHATEKVAVVHNGIIENFRELQDDLEKSGVFLESETDTEVIPQLITRYLNEGLSRSDAVEQTISQLEGAYALGILFQGEDPLLVACRHGSPLVIGLSNIDAAHSDTLYLSSDALALAPATPHLCYLEEGDRAFLRQNSLVIHNKKGVEVVREIQHAPDAGVAIGKENFRHFMQKEIFEQPSVLGDVLRSYYDAVKGGVELPAFPFPLSGVSHLVIVACGTSYYAGMVARYWIESLAGVSVSVEIASEFRYRSPVIKQNTLAICISQSGETADTLAAMRYLKERDVPVISIVNTLYSSMAREADVVLPIYAGPEIGVASTKAFTAQLLVLAVFSVVMARMQMNASEEKGQALQAIEGALLEVPGRMADVLQQDKAIESLAHEIAQAQHMLYVGRGVSYPIALEGALKLKEISYIHAEASAAGELKHGPIALVDDQMPVIAIAPRDALFEKTVSSIREVAARGGRVVLISDIEGIESLKDLDVESIVVPSFSSPYICQFLAPLIYTVPVQLLAYHVAVCKGTDVDQPRNLAKSVTVE